MTLNPVTGILIIREGDTETEGEEGHVKTEAETRVGQLQSWNTKECQEPAEGGGGGRTSSLETSESVVLPTP